MKVGDLVKSCDPYEKMLGIIVSIEPGRIGQDKMIREVKVYWCRTYATTRSAHTWAMKNGLEMISLPS
jgi:hypothetical protein